MTKSNWRALTCLLVVIFAIFALLNWQKFPFFLDIYYHLNVMRGFDAAGGIVNHAFWELAPAGNIHLYPPLFHLLLLIPYKLGLDIISIARFFSVFSFLSLLATLSFVINRLFSPKTGFFVTAAAVIPYTFFLKLTITIPVNICLILILLAFYALEKNRKIACPMLIACAFYTHLGIPWLGVLALIIYGLIKKDVFKQVMRAVLVSLLLAAPVILRVLANIHSLENPMGIRVAENKLFEFYPFIYVFAVIGLLVAISSHRSSPLRGEETCPPKRILDEFLLWHRRKGEGHSGFFFVALFIGFLPMAFNYRYRFLSGEGLLPVVFFAGLGMEKTYDILERFLAEKRVGARLTLFYFISLFVIVNLLSPTISSYAIGRKEAAFFLMDSTLDNLLPRYKKHIRPFEINLVDSEAKEWVRVIENNTARDDIICSNWSYVGGMLSAMSGRPNAAQTFYEVKRPDVPINEFGSSKLAVWLREIDGNYNMAALRTAIVKYKFKLIAETDKAVILLRSGSFKSAPTRPVLKTGVALSVLFCGFLIICYDLARPRNKFNNLSRSSLE
jgi:hypothetical protein